MRPSCRPTTAPLTSVAPAARPPEDAPHMRRGGASRSVECHPAQPVDGRRGTERTAERQTHTHDATGVGCRRRRHVGTLAEVRPTTPGAAFDVFRGVRPPPGGGQAGAVDASGATARVGLGARGGSSGRVARVLRTTTAGPSDGLQEPRSRRFASRPSLEASPGWRPRARPPRRPSAMAPRPAAQRSRGCAADGGREPRTFRAGAAAAARRRGDASAAADHPNGERRAEARRVARGAAAVSRRRGRHRHDRKRRHHVAPPPRLAEASRLGPSAETRPERSPDSRALPRRSASERSAAPPARAAGPTRRVSRPRPPTRPQDVPGAVRTRWTSGLPGPPATSSPRLAVLGEPPLASRRTAVERTSRR